MNTLASWIDADAVSGMARDMAPPAADASAVWTVPGGETPVTRLVAEDFRLPEHFSQDPFPAPDMDLPPGERNRVRNFLEGIRLKAEHSGLIPRVPEAAETEPQAFLPVPEGGQSASLPQGQAPFRLTPLPFVPPLENPLAAALEAPRETLGTLLHLPPLPSSAGPGAAAGAVSPPAQASRRPLPHFEVPLGPLATRIRALTDWIRRQIETNDIFILDTQGCPVGDREAVPRIVASAVVLAEAARRAAAYLPDASTSALYLDLEDGRRLGIIGTPTSHGNFTLGLVLPDTLTPRDADRLRRALKRTVEADAPTALRPPPRERW
ncbi:MAG: hypothetical protein JWM59_971 [Verrucomicrobiales bacterium]|nr:hypothetical protein [Verrucomicrobiales bacterium]